MTERTRQDGAPRTTLEVLAEQVRLYTALDALGARQGALAREGDVDGLLELLAERQGLIDRLVRTGMELDRGLSGWRDMVARLPDPVRASARDMVEALGDLVERVEQRDHELMGLLEARRASVARELEGVSRGRSAASAYATEPRPAARFQDREA